MSRVLTVTPLKRNTVNLKFHFPGFGGAQLTRCSLTIPVEAVIQNLEFGLYLVLETGETLMLQKFGENCLSTVLGISCYGNFSLKLSIIDRLDRNDVEHDNDSNKDQIDNFVGQVTLSVLCHGIDNLPRNVISDCKKFSVIQACKATLNSEFNSLVFDSKLSNCQVVLDKICHGSQINSRRFRGLLFLTFPADNEKFCIAEFSSDNICSDVGLNVPKGASFEFSLSEVEVFKNSNGLGNHYDSESNEACEQAAKSGSGLTEIEIKVLIHATKLENVSQTSFERYLILNNGETSTVDLSAESVQSVKILKLAAQIPKYISDNQQSCVLKAIVNGRFEISLIELKTSQPFSVINETLCSPFGLRLESEGPSKAVVFYEVDFPKKQEAENYNSCVTCKDVDKLFSTFIKIRDKFSADVAYMRENALFGCDTLVIGDSILRYVDPSILNGNVYVQSLGGCTIEQLDYIISVLSLEQLKRLIVHIGVNNTHGYNNMCNVSEQAEKYRALVHKCKIRAPNAKIYLSAVVARFDKTYCNQWVSNLNSEICNLCQKDSSLTFISNKSVAYDKWGNKIGANFAYDNLHISEKGTRQLLCSINMITKISDYLPEESESSANESFVTAANDSMVSSGSHVESGSGFQQTYFYQIGDKKPGDNPTTSTPAGHNQQKKKKSKQNKQQTRLGWGELDVLNSFGHSSSSSAASSCAEEAPGKSSSVSEKKDVSGASGSKTVFPAARLSDELVTEKRETKATDDLMTFEDSSTIQQPTDNHIQDETGTRRQSETQLSVSSLNATSTVEEDTDDVNGSWQTVAEEVVEKEKKATGKKGKKGNKRTNNALSQNAVCITNVDTSQEDGKMPEKVHDTATSLELVETKKRKVSLNDEVTVFPIPLRKKKFPVEMMQLPEKKKKKGELKTNIVDDDLSLAEFAAEFVLSAKSSGAKDGAVSKKKQKLASKKANKKAMVNK